MKNTNTIRPALQRRRYPARQNRRLTPEAPAGQPKPATRPHDFLALCFYPGMGDHSTAA